VVVASLCCCWVVRSSFTCHILNSLLVWNSPLLLHCWLLFSCGDGCWMFLLNASEHLLDCLVHGRTCLHLRNYQGSGLCPSSRILNIEKTPFRKGNVFLLSAQWREGATLLGPLERDNHSLPSQTNSVALSPQVNYTDRATSTWRQNPSPSQEECCVS
jgi:hypothetical protein